MPFLSFLFFSSRRSQITNSFRNASRNDSDRKPLLYIYLKNQINTEIPPLNCYCFLNFIIGFYNFFIPTVPYKKLHRRHHMRKLYLTDYIFTRKNTLSL